MSAKIDLLPEDRESLLDWLTNGRTLADWIRGPGARYSRWGLYARINEDPQLTEAFKLSRIIGADEIADGIREYMHAEPERITDANGVTKIDPAYVSLIKARAEVDLKILAKWNSGKYGDKVTQEISGPNGAPVQIESLTVKLVRPDET